MVEIEFLESLLFLIDEPARFKILYGGRGGGKTENVARALIILALKLKLRIACFRELQNSIEESVHETIKNQIHDMQLDSEFVIQDKNIACKRTGSEFIFSGIRYKINSIKSMARIDIAWIEEANNVSKSSWEKLPPTIRGRHETDPNGMGGPFKKGPEIWLTFNPELDTDETYKRFVLQREKYAPDFIDTSIEDQEWYNKIKNKELQLIDNNDKKRFTEIRNKRYAFVHKLNWSDNKWFPPDLKRDMLLLKAVDEDEWLHVWEGNTKQTLTGAIYSKEIKKVLLDGRRGKVPYDASRPVHTFWDLGHGDHTCIWFVQQVGVEYNLINYFQDRLQKIPYYLEHLQSLHYNYGFHYLPHDGDNETLASRSTAKFVRDAYPGKVKIVPRVSKKIVGIRAARVVFDLCNFDEENTAEGWQCLCRYQFKVDEETQQFSKDPWHNEYSDGADAFQTFALSLKPEQVTKPPKTVTSGRVLHIGSKAGWMR